MVISQENIRIDEENGGLCIDEPHMTHTHMSLSDGADFLHQRITQILCHPIMHIFSLLNIFVSFSSF